MSGPTGCAKASRGSADKLSAARDLDVFAGPSRQILQAGQQGHRQGCSRSWSRTCSAAYAAAAETLSEHRYLELLDRLEGETGASRGRPSKTRLRRVFRDELDRCRKTFDRLGQKPADEAPHPGADPGQARPGPPPGWPSARPGRRRCVPASHEEAPGRVGEHQDIVDARGRWAEVGHPVASQAA